MVLSKNKHLLAAIGLTVGLFMALFSIANPVPASAAPEGCYEKTQFTGVVRHELVECPDILQSFVDGPSESCYVTTDRNATEVSQFEAQACGSFEDNTTRTAPIQPANPNPTDSPDFGPGITEDCEGEQLNSDNCSIVEYLVITINFLSAVAGMVIVGSIMMAGYQYMTARDNSGQIMKARLRIVWTLVALVLFVFMYSLLNFLVPGGVL